MRVREPHLVGHGEADALRVVLGHGHRVQLRGPGSVSRPGDRDPNGARYRAAAADGLPSPVRPARSEREEREKEREKRVEREREGEREREEREKERERGGERGGEREKEKDIERERTR